MQTLLIFQLSFIDQMVLSDGTITNSLAQLIN